MYLPSNFTFYSLYYIFMIYIILGMFQPIVSRKIDISVSVSFCRKLKCYSLPTYLFVYLCCKVWGFLAQFIFAMLGAMGTSRKQISLDSRKLKNATFFFFFFFDVPWSIESGLVRIEHYHSGLWSIPALTVTKFNGFERTQQSWETKQPIKPLHNEYI